MMKRDGEGYVLGANDKLSGTPPTSGSALTPVECASCKALRQRIEELERQIMQMSVNAHYRICAVCGRENRNEASEWGDICPNCREEETTNLAAATKRIEELEAAGCEAMAVLAHISAMNSDYVAADFAIEKLWKAGIILGGRDERIG